MKVEAAPSGLHLAIGGRCADLLHSRGRTLDQLGLHRGAFGQTLLAPDDDLLGSLDAVLHLDEAGGPHAEIHLAPGDGKLLAEIHEYGEVLDQRTIGERLVLRARVGEKLAGRLRRAGAIVERDGTNGS